MNENTTQPAEDLQPQSGQTADAIVAASTTSVAEDAPAAPENGAQKRGCWSKGWAFIKWWLRHWRFTLVLIVLLLIGYGTMVVYRNFTSTDAAVQQPIEASPEVVVRLQAIGQWEFLSVDAEELVERHNTGLMSERDLVCIYRGTLRIGIDMHKLAPDWMEVNGRNVVLHLPQPALLDDNFLDESRTTVFFEQGVYRHEERQAMLEEAKNNMKKRALTPDNLSKARRNAEAQLVSLLRAMGYEEVVVEFAPNNTITTN